MVRRIFGTVLVVLGSLLVAAALVLTGWNFWNEEQSGASAQSAMQQLESQLQNAEPEQTKPQHSTSIFQPAAPNEATVPEEDLYRAMPEVFIDGIGYIGYLNIPALDLDLPVIGETNDENLKIAPCRFFGTVYQKNFVIGGHSYRKHFRKLSSLGYGERLSFTDMDGNVYTYEVADCEVVQPYEAEYLCTGNWDLTLFTCTPGGLTRVVLRCGLVE